MGSKLRTIALAGLVAAAALVPLFGDPRQTPVTHALWARMLLRSLDMPEAVRASGQASQVFSALAWKDSLAYSAEQYLRAQGVVRGAGGGLVAAAQAPAELSYPLAVVQPGSYFLRARLEGVSTTPATLELVPLGGGRSLGAFSLAPAGPSAWSDGGPIHLDPGAYAAQFLLPPGVALHQLEVAPPCLNPIEPKGGWSASAIATSSDVAVTTLEALDAEHELPPAGTAIELTGADFSVEAPSEAVAIRARATGFGTINLRASRGGLRAVVSVDLPSPGLYGVSAFVAPGGGQRWLFDGCRKAVVCPAVRAGWRPILSQSFAAGRHTLVLTLAEDASVERLRFEPKDGAAERYVETLRRLGLDVGAAGPVARTTALDAARFVRERRRARLALLCGDTVPFDEAGTQIPTVASISGPAKPGGGVDVPPGGGVAPPPPPPVEPPVGPPLLPPQPPATPTAPADRT